MNIVDQLAENIFDNYSIDDIERFLGKQDYTEYQKDPVGFCEKELGMTLTPDVQTMMASVRDKKVTIAISGNATGKTHGASAVAIWFKKAHPNSQVIMAACPPSDRNLKLKLWGELKTVIRAHAKMWENYDINALRIQQKDDERSFIDGVTIPAAGTEEERESKFSGQHAPHLLFVLDEGDAIPDEVFRAIDGCMSGGHCRLLVMFNPKQRKGEAYRKIKEGHTSVVRLDALKHPNVLTGKDVIPGAVTRDKVVQRINEWTKPLMKGEEVDSGCFKIPKFLVGKTTESDKGDLYPVLQAGYRRVEIANFYYMVLGQYPILGSNQLISEEWINKARSRWDMYVAEFGRKPPVGVRPEMGMDVADEGGDYNSACSRYGGWVEGFDKWRGMDLDRSSLRAKGVYADKRALSINVESDGLGAGIPPRLKRLWYWYCEKCKRTYTETDLIYCPDCSDEEKNVNAEMKKEYLNVRKVIMSSSPTEKTEMGEFNRMRDQLWWACREWLRTDTSAALPPDEHDWEELLVPTFSEWNGKIKIMAKDDMKAALGRSPDKADSLIQTFFTKGRPRIRMVNWGDEE